MDVSTLQNGKWYAVYTKDIRNFADWHSGSEVRKIVDKETKQLCIKGEYIASESNETEIAIAQIEDLASDGKSNIVTIPVDVIDNVVELQIGERFLLDRDTFEKVKRKIPIITLMLTIIILGLLSFIYASWLSENKLYEYDCSDFITHEDAWAIFRQSMEDVHKLDADNDGIPCEHLL